MCTTPAVSNYSRGHNVFCWHPRRMDGYQATREIRRRSSQGQTLPIIGLTAGYATDNLEKYAEAGMNECIAKPFRVSELERIFSQWVKK